MHRDRRIMHTLAYMVLVPSSLLVLIPFAWIVSTAFKSRPEVFTQTLQWLPRRLVLSNFTEAWQAAPFGTYYVNTVLIVSSLEIVQIVTVTLAAYSFARLTFRGREFLFILFLIQLMITPQSTVLANYMTINSLKLLNTRTAIILPYFASAYGTFLLRQAFRTIPQELEDAASIDGCGGLRFLWHVGVPLIRPALLTFVIISVNHHWNEFFWPLMVTESKRVRTLTIGLSVLAVQSESGAEWTLLMAATLLVIAPLIVLFLVFQRRFIDSFMQAGLKG